MPEQINTWDGFLTGLLGGLITGVTGAYKDTTFEPFELKKFFRSPIIASIYGVIGSRLFPENKSYLLLLTFSISMERITVETWKALNSIPPGKFSWGESLDKGWLTQKLIVRS